MSNVTIRAARRDDWEHIAALLTCYDLPLDGAKEHLDQFIVFVEKETVRGVAGMERYGSVGLLRSVAVTGQGKGVGEKLVRTLIERARAQGVKQLVLLTTTAADYFPRFGFTRIERSDAPELVHASAEFQGACPDSAVVMLLTLD